MPGIIAENVVNLPRCIKYDGNSHIDDCKSPQSAADSSYFAVYGVLPNIAPPQVRGFGPEGNHLCEACQYHKYG